MQGQWYDNGRYRMHYTSINVPSAFKCYSCGLCGDFNIFSSGLTTEEMEACDGTMVSYRAGWVYTSTPEAYDTYGWTWEKAFVDNSCNNNYDNTDNMLDNEDPEDPCSDAVFAATIDEACENAIINQEDCCDQIGNNFCEGLLTDCKVDACVGANGDVTAIPSTIDDLVVKPIEEVCANEDLQDPDGAIPDPILECPTGSIIVATDGNNNIVGGGIDSARFNVDTIEDCESKCQLNADCDAFSWAPIGGDAIYPDTTVCTLYDSAIPTSNHGPNQIFCSIVPRTCTLIAYTMADDNHWVYRSDDNGDSYTEKNDIDAWGELLTTTFSGVTSDTVIKVSAQNTGGPGGFIAKFSLTNDMNGNSKEIITDNPISTMRVTDIDDNDLNPADLSYANLGEGDWPQLNDETRPQVSGAIWTIIPETTYNFYLSLTTTDLNDVGCIVRTREVETAFSCQRRTGSSSSNTGSPSIISCDTGEILVSCGIAGTDQLQGTYIDPLNPNTCVAGTSSNSWSVTAVAYCCTFPEDSVNTVSTITSEIQTTDNQILTQCPANYVVTGCQVNYQSGITSNIRGSYPGPQQGSNTPPSQTGVTDGIDTENQCISESRTSMTNIRGGAQCIEMAPDYVLDCVTSAEYTNQNGFDGNCPTGYQLMACMTYTTTYTLDAWYITESGNGCYVQQDNHANQYANGICCKLTEIVKNPGQTVVNVSKLKNKKKKKNSKKTSTHDDTFVYSAKSHRLHNIRNDHEENNSYYLESVCIVGLVLVLCVVGLYWRKNKKLNGYEPIKGIDSEEINPFLQESRV